jgi:hypothetical protein
MSTSWKGMFAYAFPPFRFFSQVLQKVARESCNIILIAPAWPRSRWGRSQRRLMALKITCSNSHSVFTGVREHDSVSASTLRWSKICLSRGKLSLRVVVSSTTEGTHQPVGDESSSSGIVSFQSNSPSQISGSGNRQYYRTDPDEDDPKEDWWHWTLLVVIHIPCSLVLKNVTVCLLVHWDDLEYASLPVESDVPSKEGESPCERNVRLRIPSLQVSFPNPSKGGSGILQDHSYCTGLAKRSLVHRSAASLVCWNQFHQK